MSTFGSSSASVRRKLSRDMGVSPRTVSNYLYERIPFRRLEQACGLYNWSIESFDQEPTGLRDPGLKAEIRALAKKGWDVVRLLKARDPVQAQREWLLFCGKMGWIFNLVGCAVEMTLHANNDVVFSLDRGEILQAVFTPNARGIQVYLKKGEGSTSSKSSPVSYADWLKFMKNTKLI